MPLLKIPSLGFGHLRAKLARTAKSVLRPRRHGSAGPNTASPSSTLNVEKSREAYAPIASPPSTVRKTASVRSKADFATKFALLTTILLIEPKQSKAAGQLMYVESPSVRSDACSQIGMVPLDQPWFSRRKSSLMRISASSLRINDDVRSPQTQVDKQHEFVPLAHTMSVSGEGIEMEMDDFFSASNAYSLETNSEELYDADDDASVFTLERVPFLVVHRANPFRFAPSTIPSDETSSVASTPTLATSFESCTDGREMRFNDQEPFLTKPPRAKLRPVPLPVYSMETARLTQPFPVQGCYCVISESPLSFRSVDGCRPDTPDKPTTILLWPNTARSSVSLVRPGTADSCQSRYQSEWW